LINQSAYEDGWLYRIELSHPEELEQLLDAEQYTHCVEE